MNSPPFAAIRRAIQIVGISLLLALPASAVSYSYTFNSQPTGLVNQHGTAPAGTTVTTSSLQGANAGFTFAYWLVNGVRQADASGAATPAASFVLNNDTTATAVYVATTDDTDNDGIPDWYEWQQFGSLDQNGASNPSGDGITVATDLARGYSPTLANALWDGGIASRRSTGALAYTGLGSAAYTFDSEPAGFVNQSGSAILGTTITTPSLQGANSGYTFAYWRVNGVRQADASGAATPAASFVLSGNTTATAVYIATTDDTDNDGIPDWYEWQQFGSLNQNGASDPSGDGITVATDLARGYSPTLANALWDGGIASRRSTGALAYTGLGSAAYTFDSEPAGFVNQSGSAILGTTITTPSLQGANSGYTFAYWRVNGVRQADASGAATPAASFVLSGNTTATAVYIATTDDTDNDGLPDWYEWQQFGNLRQSGNSDPNGDGIPIATELARGYSPTLANTVWDGGIASRRSAASLTFAPPTPSTPAAVGAYASSTTMVTITWRPPADGTSWTGYRIDRATDSTFSQGLITFTQSTTATSYVDTSATANTTYYYRIYAMNADRVSSPTQSVVVQTPASMGTSPGYFTNISARAYCATGSQVAIGGFVVAGNAPKRVLVRAIGPSLAAQGVPAAQVLADPVIELHQGSAILSTNDNWADNGKGAEITSLSAQVGAQAIQANDTTSSAMAITLAPGVYTFLVHDKNNGAGIVLLELYDADASPPGSWFVNISARQQVGTGNNVAIGGFVIAGPGRKQVLVRAVGPTLALDGLSTSELLANPVIELYSGAKVIATNDDWLDNANAAAIAATAARVGAQGLDQSDATSSALLLTLPPGVYSFVASGKNGTSGIVLIEIYDAD